MAMRWTAVLAAIAAIGAAGAQGFGRTMQQEMAEQLDLFSLCSPGERIDVAIDELPGHAAGAGLTQGAIRGAVEDRLRRARLLDPNAEPLLHVEIVLGDPRGEHIPFYSVEVRYLRDLMAERIGVAALAETWSMSVAGRGDAPSFLDHLGVLVDEFIAEYQRIRDSEACREAAKPRPPEPDSQSGG